MIEYTYDMAGIRDSKTVDGVEYNYLTLDGKVVRQTWGSNILDIIYDNSGLPYALKYNGAYYIYVLNQQGDVIRIVNSTGATVAEYRYDAWGNVIYSNGSMAAVNPIRYRGYYYDTETGFYYLQSRYYDPGIGRFINADSFASTGQGFLGYNMFAYCNNNPVNLADTTGTFPWVIAGLAILGAIAVDHWVAANHPEGFALDERPVADGITDKFVYAEGNGFELDANGMTVCDVEVGLFSRSGEKGNASGSIGNFVTASAVAEFDWSGMPSAEASAMAALYTNSIEVTIPIGNFDVTIILEGHMGAVGAGIELDPDSGRFVITPPMAGAGCTYGADLDIR